MGVGGSCKLCGGDEYKEEEKVNWKYSDIVVTLYSDRLAVTLCSEHNV